MTERLTAAEIAALRELADDPATHPRLAPRASIVLRAADGGSVREIAASTGVSAPTVTVWRDRYARLGIEGLDDRPRPGRPKTPRPPDAASRAADRAAAPSRDEPEDAGPQSAVVEALLDAASRTISRRGFASTRVSDIAEAAGVAPATVHYHFKTREESLVRALLWANRRALARLDDRSRATDDATTRLRRFIERSIPYPGLQRDEYLLEIDLWSSVRLYPSLLPAWERYTERWVDRVADIISDGLRAGVFTSSVDGREAAERLMALTDGLSAQAAIGSTRMPAGTARNLVLRFAADQLGIARRELGCEDAVVPGR